jgi:hypothetical protein
MIVRSSISSSERRSWIATWSVTAVVCVALFTAWEGFWRHRGFEPSVTDDAGLWAAERRSLKIDDPEEVVIVGSSRIQLGINPDAFVAATGWRRPVQLAVAMGASVPVLRHLAEAGFRGLVICEVNPRIFFEKGRSLDRVVGSYLRKYRSLTLGDIVEERLRAWVQQTFVTPLPALSTRELLLTLRQGRLPTPQFITVDRDRYRYADYSHLPSLGDRIRRVRRLRERSELTFLDPQGVGNRVGEVAELVRHIREGGGEVIFVRLPTSDHILENERRTVPRERYWDRLASGTEAIAIHFQDHPELASFTAPDGEHLDREDAVVFARALGKILAREIALRRGG